MKVITGPLTLEVVQGNIVVQPDIEAIVNAANAQLLSGGGVAGIIHRTAGPALEKACRPLAPIRPGEAVTTEAFALPNSYIIHTLGPVYGVDKPEAQLLARCYRAALEQAEAYHLHSVAFPAISTGAFGYPVQEAAQIAIETLMAHASDAGSVRHIRIVLFSSSDFHTHEKVLAQYQNEQN